MYRILTGYSVSTQYAHTPRLVSTIAGTLDFADHLPSFRLRRTVVRLQIVHVMASVVKTYIEGQHICYIAPPGAIQQALGTEKTILINQHTF